MDDGETRRDDVRSYGMPDAAVGHFKSRAAEYEAERRRVVPGFDAFYGAAVAALALAGREIRRVLDLGAGTGLLAAHVVAAHPRAEITLLDGASECSTAPVKRSGTAPRTC